MALSKIRESANIFKSPQCLIDTNTETGRMEVQQGALEEISKIEQQLNVMAITGLYRTGKSYLLTRLAGECKGFPLGSTVQSKTKGIWVWCRQHPVHKDQVLMLLDSEGLGDVEKGDSNHDNKLFSLITLLCSTLIYNMIGVFNQEALDKLNFITEISKHIKTKESSVDDGDLDRYFPELILALRDHTLELVLDERRVNSDEYFEHCLTLLQGTDEDTMRKNKPRQCIRKYFPKRHCFTFERPGNTKALRNLDKMSDKDLEKQFVEDTKRFLNYVWNNCKPMETQNGHPITGSIFGCLLHSYVKAVNDGGIPCIESTLTTMAEIENQKAVNLAVETYTELMAKKVVLPVSDDNKLGAYHNECSKAAMDIFAEKSMFDESKKHFNRTNNMIWDQYERIKRENDQISETNCTVLLEKLYGPIKANIRNGKYSVAGGHKKYRHDFKTLKEKYRNSKESLGPKKDDILRRFKDKTRAEGEAILQGDQKVSAAEKEKELEKQQKEAAQRQVQSVEEEKAKIQRKIHEYEKQMEKSVKKIKEEHQAEMKKMKENNEKIINARIEEKTRLYKENQKEEAEKAERTIQQLKNDNEKMLMDCREKMAKIDETSKRQKEELERKNREESERSEQWKEKLRKAQGDRDILDETAKRFEEDRQRRADQEREQRNKAEQSNSEGGSGSSGVLELTQAGITAGGAIGGAMGGPAGAAAGAAVGSAVGLVIAGWKALWNME